MAGCTRMKVAGLLIALCCVLLVAACGKKGPPSPPGPANEVTWPRPYPTY